MPECIAVTRAISRVNENVIKVDISIYWFDHLIVITPSYPQAAPCRFSCEPIEITNLVLAKYFNNTNLVHVVVCVSDKPVWKEALEDVCGQKA